MNDNDTRTFNATAHEETVRKMKDRGERVHDEGERVYRTTGKLDQSVNIFGAKRVSRNAFVKNPDGTCTLAKGIKLAAISETDGTGSMGEKVAKAFYAMEGLYARLDKFSDRYQIDLSVAVVQDVQDTHPVVQMAEFESDNRAADHVRMLIPDKDGGDATEDYDLGLWYVDNEVEIDINRYGLKGYFFLVLDAIGRGEVTASKVKTHLGHEMQASSISTKDICRNLLTKWHLFVIQVEGSDTTASWWESKVGKGRVIYIDDSDLLGEVQASLVYVTETAQPTKEGLKEFLSGASNKRLYEGDMERIWTWLQTAKAFFGAQAKLPGYNNIPKPGDVFQNYRDVWPIGHTEQQAAEAPKNEGAPINWNNF